MRSPAGAPTASWAPAPAPKAFVGATSLALDPGVNRAGGPADNWVRWSRVGLVSWRGPLAALPDIGATLESLATSGASAVGLSVEWARVAPAPGQLDHQALEGYARLAAAAAAAGLDPVVTLHHRCHPAWLGEEFWLTPGSPEAFADHVVAVVGALAASCRRWVTVQSPGRLARGGWVTGALPPRRRGALADAYAVMDNLMTAHLLAERHIRRARPDALVALGHGASDLYDEGPLALDVLTARARGVGPADLDGHVARRRKEAERQHPARGPGQILARAGARALSPFGRPTGPRAPGAPAGWGDVLALPCPRRALGEAMGPEAPPGPDAVAVVWDLAPSPRRGRPGDAGDGGGLDQSVLEWCKAETARHGLPLWLVVPGQGLVPSPGELATLAAADHGGIPLQGWLRLVPGPLLVPRCHPGGPLG